MTMRSEELEEQIRTESTDTSAKEEASVHDKWANLRDETGLLNKDVQGLHGKVSQNHRQAVIEELERLTAAKARSDVRALLTELADRGFSWRTIARLVGVSVPALRRWRTGEAASGENRKAVARFAAVIEMLESAMINDVASWMEIPIHDHHDDYRISCIDLYAADRIDLVLDWGRQFVTDPHTLLDDFRPNWRKEFDSAWEVFEAEDGSRGLQPKKRSTT